MYDGKTEIFIVVVVFSMATRGRPARIFYDSDLGKIVRFAMRMEFRT